MDRRFALKLALGAVTLGIALLIPIGYAARPGGARGWLLQGLVLVLIMTFAVLLFVLLNTKPPGGIDADHDD